MTRVVVDTSIQKVDVDVKDRRSSKVYRKRNSNELEGVERGHGNPKVRTVGIRQLADGCDDTNTK